MRAVTSSRSGPTWVQLMSVASFAIAVRVVSALLAFFANVLFPFNQPEQFTVFGRTHAFWDTFARYDTGWYVGIARDGYRFVEGGRSNLAFFPAYPMAMRAAGLALGGRPSDYFLGGVLVSWVAYVLGMVALFQLARQDLDDDGAWRAVVLASVFPFAFFFGVAYSESLFVASMVTSMYGFRTGRWTLAGASGALAVCARVNGIMALPALAWLAWEGSGGTLRERRPWLALGAVVAGFCGWCAYVYGLSGNPFEWASSIQRWGYEPGGAPWSPLLDLLRALWQRGFQFLSTERMAPYDTLNGLAALSCIAALPFVWYRLGTAYGLFVAANLALPLSSGQFEGLGRYCAVLFPVSIWLATLRFQPWQSFWLFTSSALYMLGLTLFTKVHPLF